MVSRTSRVVVVTGYAPGNIGSSLCAQFARSGCKVYALTRHVVDNKLDQPGPVYNTYTCDLNNDESISDNIKSIIDSNDGIDLLVNYTQARKIGPILDIAMSDVVKEYENSVFSVLRIVKAVAPYMVARKRGTIINIGSLAGQVSAPFGGLFASTKSALHMLTDTLDMELRPFGIHVTLVITGLTRTNLDNEAQARIVSEVGGQSLYTGFLDSMSVRVALSQWTKAMPADKMARQIVQQLLSKRPPRTIYAGSLTRRMRLLTFLPRTLVLTFLWFYMIRLPSLLASIGLV